MEPNLQKGFEIVKGSLDDVLFVSRIGQKDWAGTEKVLTEFFVILPGVTVIKFRLLKTSPFTLLPKDIVDYILGDPRWQTNDSSKLYFRGGELAPGVPSMLALFHIEDVFDWAGLPALDSPDLSIETVQVRSAVYCALCTVTSVLCRAAGWISRRGRCAPSLTRTSS